MFSGGGRGLSKPQMLVGSRSLCATLQTCPLGWGWFPPDSKAKGCTELPAERSPRGRSPAAFLLILFFFNKPIGAEFEMVLIRVPAIKYVVLIWDAGGRPPGQDALDRSSGMRDQSCIPAPVVPRRCEDAGTTETSRV